MLHGRKIMSANKLLLDRERGAMESGVGTARHAARATTPAWRLLLRFMARGRLEYLLTFPSNQAWRILLRKYDAFTTDHAYDERPSSWLGPLGWWADRRVLSYPLHVAMRDRLRLVTDELVAAVAGAPGGRPARVLSAPCGLCRDIIGAAAELRTDGSAGPAVAWHALDLDARGDVIPEARRRTAAAGMQTTFFRGDIFDPAGVRLWVAAGGRFDAINCIGLTTWLSLEEVARLAAYFHDEALQPGGTLLIDNWAPHAHSRSGEDLEIFAAYHPPADFAAALTDAGFTIERVTPTPNGACTLTVARAR
jgi:hypothetical protein